MCAINGFHIVVALVVLQASESGFSAQARTGDGRGSAVEFYVGGEIKYSVKSFRYESAGTEMAGRFTGLAAKGIPIGNYNYTLVPTDARRPEAEELTGSVYVIAAEHWIVLKASIASFIDYNPEFVTGRLKLASGRGSEPYWVRLEGLLPYPLQAKVKPDGSFRIQGARLEGHYVLTVWRGSKLLHAKALYLDGMASRALGVVAW